MASLSEKVEALFRGHPATLIDFSLDGLRVNGTNFRKVADAIKKGTIGVEIGDTGDRLAAGYGQRKLTIRKEFDTEYPEGKAMIVHEGVHAWADLSNFKSGLSDEAAAYVTEVLYLHAVNRRLSGHPIYDAANEVVETHGLQKKHGVALKREDCESLRSAIHSDPAYQSLSD